VKKLTLILRFGKSPVESFKRQSTHTATAMNRSFPSASDILITYMCTLTMHQQILLADEEK
jgi:hypothetical protein